jgi:hypothetical protein
MLHFNMLILYILINLKKNFFTKLIIVLLFCLTCAEVVQFFFATTKKYILKNYYKLKSVKIV